MNRDRIVTLLLFLFAIALAGFVLGIRFCGENSNLRADKQRTSSLTVPPQSHSQPALFPDGVSAYRVQGEHQPFVSSTGCGNDEFFVDVEEGGRPVGARFQETLAQQLTARIRSDFCAWFGPGAERLEDIDCHWSSEEDAYRRPAGAPDLRAVVEPVFKQLRSDASRACIHHDGPRRFFRVRFVEEVVRPKGGPDASGRDPEEVRLHVPDVSLCTVENAIETAAETTAERTKDAKPLPLCGDPRPSENSERFLFHVGRECPVQPVSVASRPYDELKSAGMLDWHLERLQATQPKKGSLPPSQRPKLWLLDTGVYPSIAEALEIDQADPPGFGAVLNRHGSAMAALARQISEPHRLDMESVRLASTPTRITSQDLAQGLEEVWLSTLEDKKRAHIVNLSLGWPPQLTLPTAARPICGAVATALDSTRRRFQYEDCTRDEDSFGAAVKFALALFRFGGSNASVVAAPGTAPPPEPDSPNSAKARGSSASRGCGESGGVALDESSDADTMFYPAEWGRKGRRWNPIDRSWQSEVILTTPAGAIDPRQRRVPMTRPKGGLDLELPGQHVYVANRELVNRADVVKPLEEPVCNGQPPIDPERRVKLQVPSAWTGSSVSTVLLSSLIGDAQFRWSRATDTEPLSWGQALTLLRFTGRPVENHEGRIPSMCRVGAVLEDTGSCGSSLRKCLEVAELHPESADDALRSQECRDAQERCSSTMEKCRDDPKKPTWPRDHRFRACRELPLRAKRPSKCTADDPCPARIASSSIQLQSAGCCVECGIRRNSGSSSSNPRRTFDLEVVPDVEKGTQLRLHWVRIIYEDETTEFLEPFEENGAKPALHPGEHIRLVEVHPNHLGGTVVSATTLIELIRPDGSRVMDDSPLRVNLDE